MKTITLIYIIIFSFLLKAEINLDSIEIIFKHNISQKELYSNNLNNSSSNKSNHNKLKHHKGNDNILEYKNQNKIQVQFGLPDNFPEIKVNSTSLDNGFVFLSNITETFKLDMYLLIIDSYGKPFYYKKMTDYNDYCTDFKLQANGLFTYYSNSAYAYLVMDSSFTVIDTIRCKNGAVTDLHELIYLPNGHKLLMGDEYKLFDLTSLNPKWNPNAVLYNIIIQELDESDNVVFEWNSFDHYNILDATNDIDVTGNNPVIDYAHSNALIYDNDGNYIISNRNMDEITKINSQTGDIIWRWGGKNNQFKFINDSIGFSHQHAIRRIENGNITMLDNGNLHWDKAPSRALEYKLDEVNKTAELVWQYVNSPSVHTEFMGSMQRLANGNSFIEWSDTNTAAAIEINSKNQKIYEMWLPENVSTYRAYKFNLNSSYYSSFVPKLLEPAIGDNFRADSIRLVWSKNKFAQGFNIQVAMDSDFTQLIYNKFSFDTTVVIHSIDSNTQYFWRVKSYNNNDTVGGFNGYANISTFNTNLFYDLKISQNFPNPFTEQTLINYSIPNNSNVEIVIYNSLGREICKLLNEFENKGNHQIIFYSNDLPNGIYYCKLQSESNKSILPIVLLK